MKMLDAKIQSMCNEFSLLVSTELQKLQEANEKWMRLAENLVLQSGVVTEELKIALGSGNRVTIACMQAHDDRLNQLHDMPLHLKFVRSEAATPTPSQEPKSLLGDEHHRLKEIAPIGSLEKVATTINKSAEVTIQDIEDALRQIETAAAKDPL
jgi:malate synthase